jgi:hypothetical protein
VHYSIVDEDGNTDLKTLKLDKDTQMRLAHLRSVNLMNHFVLDAQDAVHTTWVPRLRQYSQSPERAAFIAKGLEQTSTAEAVTTVMARGR